MEFDDLAKQCKKLAYEGKDFEEITQQVSLTALSKSEQQKLRSLIDDFIVQYNLASQVKYRHTVQIMLGAIALLLGIFILIFTYFRRESGYGIGFAACLVGLYVIKKGYDQYKQPVDFQHIAPEKDSKFHRY